MSRLRGRLRSLWLRRRLDQDIPRELAHHIAMETQRRVQSGMSPDEARRTALRDFGGVGRIREEVRDERGLTFWDTLVQDLRFGFRTLRRSPGYSLAAILILGLGIGANTAMFSVINGVLIKPLPFRSGDELMLVQQSAPKSNIANAGVSIFELYDYRTRLQSVRDLVEHHSMSFTLLDQGEPDRVGTGVVSANFFDMLGIRPLHGRSFRDGDDDLGAEAVLMLSYEYWQSKFGGDEKVIGRVLQMNNRPHTIVGVLPAYPQFPQLQDIYMPTSACPFRAGAEQNPGEGPGNGHRAFNALTVFGRLAPSRSEAQASAEIATVASTYPAQFPREYDGLTGFTGAASSLRETLVTPARSLLLTLTAVTMLVLLIACANVANLALSRTVRRNRELAVRTALGAGRWRLVRQLLTESLIVSVAGGVLGLALAWLSLDILVGFVGRFTTRTGQIEIDGGVLAYTLVAAIVSGVIFGLVPALSARPNLSPAMRDGAAQAGEGLGRQRLRKGLVVAQVAVSFVLLVGAALLLESFYRMSSIPLGYDSQRVMTAAIFGNFSRTPDYAAILERLRSSPGVRAAAITNAVPQRTQQPVPQPFTIVGRPQPPESRLVANQGIASDSYFEAIDVPLLAGRDFRSGDTVDAPRVAVINASMAAFWDGADPIGTQFTVPARPQPLTFTVIGVVGDFRLYSVDNDLAAQFYRPIAQTGGLGARLLVRTEGAIDDLPRTIKAAVHAVDPQIPVEDLQTLAEVRNGRLETPGLTTALLGIFAAVALCITLAGIAGLIGTSVSQRTREFGLRMALGASRASVLRLVLGQGLVLVAIGVVLGLAGAYWFSSVLSDSLFRTTPYDVGAYAAVAVVFLAAAMLATFAPARRATTIDPLKALKTE
jgi:putative ABC transport system permease protein